ncbi:MAG: AI-2E family transporter [Oscillospiraceae bacterium]
MKNVFNQRYWGIALYSLFVVACSIGLFQITNNLIAINDWIYNLFRPIFPIFYGFIIAYLLNPIMMTVEKYISDIKFKKKISKKTKRGISLFITFVFATILIIAFLVIVLPRVAESLSNMVLQIQDYVSSAQRFVSDIFDKIPSEVVPEGFENEINAKIGKLVTNFISTVGNSVPKIVGIAFNIGNGIISMVMGIIVSCYLLYSKEIFLAQIKKVAVSILPSGKIGKIAAILDTTDSMFGRFITGKIIDSIIIGFLCFLGLFILKIPNAVLVSFIVGITNIIPYFGPFLGAIPSFILIAFISPTKGIIFLAFVLFLQQLDGNVIGPMILGDSTGLSAFWVVFAILFFGGAFGIVGMVIGVPTLGVIFWIIKMKIFELLKEKNMPTETDYYMRSIDKIIDENKKEE